MRLRRLELVIVGITLAFACFIGGYLVGRSHKAISISPTVSARHDPQPPLDPPSPPPQTEAQAPQEVAPGNDDASPGTPPQTPPPPSSRDSQGRININVASRSELMDLPGIGPSLSERIVDYRKDNGPFSRIEDIRNVSGIGERRYEAIRDMITVG